LYFVFFDISITEIKQTVIISGSEQDIQREKYIHSLGKIFLTEIENPFDCSNKKILLLEEA